MFWLSKKIANYFGALWQWHFEHAILLAKWFGS